ncbi:MAG TPA: hypothetical protein VIS48_05730 [Candidatus Kryptonia bacterium]
MNLLTVAFLAQAMFLSGAGGSGGPGNHNEWKYPDNRVSTETIEKSLKIESGTLILLDTEMGNINIGEYDGKDVQIEMTVEGTPEDISRIHFTHDYFRNQVTLTAWYDGTSEAQEARLKNASFTIRLPRDSSYSLRTKTQLGNINAVVSRNTKGVDLSAEAGSVWLRVPCDIAATIDASTSGIGGVQFLPAERLWDLCFSSEISKGDHLKGTMHGGGEKINAYAGSGNVYFEVEPRK